MTAPRLPVMALAQTIRFQERMKALSMPSGTIIGGASVLDYGQ